MGTVKRRPLNKRFLQGIAVGSAVGLFLGQAAVECFYVGNLSRGMGIALVVAAIIVLAFALASIEIVDRLWRVDRPPPPAGYGPPPPLT